jgi:hypothetical protein
LGRRQSIAKDLAQRNLIYNKQSWLSGVLLISECNLKASERFSTSRKERSFPWMSDHPLLRESRSFSGKTAYGAREIAGNWAGGMVGHPLCDDRRNVGEVVSRDVSVNCTDAGSWCALLLETRQNRERTSTLVVPICDGPHPLVI